jgi:hypothetical protein
LSVFNIGYFLFIPKKFEEFIVDSGKGKYMQAPGFRPQVPG